MSKVGTYIGWLILIGIGLIAGLFLGLELMVRWVEFDKNTPRYSIDYKF